VHLNLCRTTVLRSIALVVAALSCASPNPVPPPTTPTPQQPPNKVTATPAGGISAEDLRTKLFAYAADSMEGREAGTPANIRSTAYIEREARRIGLQPAGDSGTFFQTVPLVRRAVVAGSTLSVEGQQFALGTDYLAIPQSGGSASIDGATAIYGGVFGDTASLISPDLARGKLVILSPPPRGPRAFIPRILRTSKLAGAAAVAVATLDGMQPALIDFLRQPRVTLANAADVAANDGGTPKLPLVMLITNKTAETLLGMPLTQAKLGATGRAVHGTLSVTEVPAAARNVVAVFPGQDATLKRQYVALGAHSDHIGIAAQPVDHDSLRTYNDAEWALRQRWPDGNRPTPEQLQAIHVNVDSLHKLHPARRDSINNGADDDGSGTVSLLEIAQAFAAAPSKPQRSILFVWHTGEEKGLLGSQWFTEHSTVPRDSIVTQLNLDMVGRGGPQDIKGGGPTYLELVGSRRLSTELGDIVEAVNKTETPPLTLDYAFDANGHPENIYCRSDHASYARYGIPVTFFTTGLHQDYHQVTDEPQYIDYEHLARVDKFVFDVATKLADLDHRPLVDKPKPDPNVPCRQ